MTIYWDPDVYNYVRENGEYLTQDEIFELSEQSLEDNSDVVATLVGLLLAGLITLSAWVLAMQIAIKEEYIRQYLIAIGGVNYLTDEDLQIIGEMLEEQYSYLDRFADDIAAGTMVTAAAIIARAMLYIYSAYGIYWIGRDNRAIFWGATMEHWWTRADREVCIDCSGFEAMGWVELGMLPKRLGSESRCDGNCRCWKSYRNAEEKEFFV